MPVPDDRVRVHYESMDLAYEDLKKVITELDRATDDLYADLQKELGAVWEGEAQKWFEQKRAEWNKLEVQMGEQLFKAATVVKVANGNYQTAERKNIQIWAD
ncbi:WXG100 family type VII secretion target [Nonomuraea sp. NPDC050691]|uniref:WXG100 family type VII secretion target n=1 Tax=Nonomuraea sp. NPDC050691 TaxID=3155661 RepID=UPI0033E1BB2C